MITADQRAFVREAVYVYNTPIPVVIASVRMVALIPARHIGMRVLAFAEGIDAGRFLKTHRPSAVILTKAFDRSMLALARAATERRIPVVTTLCDLHFSGERGALNRALCDLSTAVVVQTAAMADEVLRQFGHRCALIEEAIEYPRERPRFAPSQPLKVLWYGHENNHDSLEAGLTALSRTDLGPIHLRIVTNTLPQFMANGFPNQPPNIDFEVVQWSPEMQHSSMVWCDLAFIPSSDTPEKRVKGHSRVVEAINAGRLAVAFPSPQYRELAEFCMCSEDYAGSIRAARNDPAAVLLKIENGQRYIDTRFTPEVIADKWFEFIATLAV